MMPVQRSIAMAPIVDWNAYLTRWASISRRSTSPSRNHQGSIASMSDAARRLEDVPRWNWHHSARRHAFQTASDEEFNFNGRSSSDRGAAGALEAPFRATDQSLGASSGRNTSAAISPPERRRG
jgi:hypothetical protein